MRRFERSKKSIMESRPVLILLGVIVLIFAWSVARFAFKLAETKNNREMVEERVEALREQKKALSEDIETLGTDRGKEEFFRENFGLAKEGEEVVVIVDAKAPPPPPKPSQWQRFTAFFGGWFR